MSDSAEVARARLRAPILRSVSRSFYLSIGLLPGPLRDPVALAYLLARATDTIADTTEIDPATRTAELARLAALIQVPESPTAANFQSFAALQKDESERALMEAMPECIAWLRATPEADRASIQKVLTHINEGQMLDVQRFANATQVTALPTAADLDRYTWLVAGAVGEFWTDVCFLHLRNFAARARHEMVSLGTQYGKGLQLINILRDLGGDIAAGRCYLPEAELRSLSLTPGDLPREGRRARPIVEQWRHRAEEGIAAGMEYSCAIQPWRVRLATVLPALIGARTLALLRDAGPEIFDIRIKVPRTEVRRILVRLLMTLASPRAIRSMFKTLSS